jgi:Na+-transporting NADH:ubiquinone oxidoreductase subunit C
MGKEGDAAVRLNVNSPAYVIGFAAIISGVFTAAIMSLHAMARPVVEANEQLFHQRALVEVFALDEGKTLTDAEVSDAYAHRIRTIDRTIVDPETGATFNIPPDQGDEHSPRTYRAVVTDERTGRQTPLGYAFPIWGVGFWARIDGYMAVSTDLRRSLGIVFVRHTETPGLGGRITERTWRRKFEGLDITEPAAPGRVLYIGGQSTGPLRKDRYVDAVTGATGTSVAVEAFLRRRIAEFRRAMSAYARKERP